MKKIILTTLIVTIATAALAKKIEPVIGQNAHYEIEIKTSRGSITVELFNDTPVHRDNFVKLASENFYDNLLFHRVVEEFMIQCGDPASRDASKVALYGDGDSGYTLPAEIKAHYFHRAGVLAAAREPDDVNPEKKSSGSHFYIVVGKIYNDSTLNVAADRIRASGVAGYDQFTQEKIQAYKTEGGAAHLDGSYTIFGRVINGMPVARKISQVETLSNSRPLEDVYVKDVVVKIVEDKKK